MRGCRVSKSLLSTSIPMDPSKNSVAKHSSSMFPRVKKSKSSKPGWTISRWIWCWTSRVSSSPSPSLYLQPYCRCDVAPQERCPEHSQYRYPPTDISSEHIWSAAANPSVAPECPQVVASTHCCHKQPCRFDGRQLYWRNVRLPSIKGSCERDLQVHICRLEEWGYPRHSAASGDCEDQLGPKMEERGRGGSKCSRTPRGC